ncbi:MAG: endo-1,4-beta-xylanase [Lachnospiraceae bacterium]|nr:endo-1,4-beta-xylanase [Lachnospiraceae bacterium]
MRKTFVKKQMARFMVFAMLLTTAVGFVPAQKTKAADLSEYKNMEFGIKYTGAAKAVANEAKDTYNIEYFNVKNSKYEEGDTFYISVKVSGAKDFQQVGIPSAINNWSWSSSPTAWADNGIEDGTVVSGKVTATQGGNNISLKLQFDHVIGTPAETPEITLEDLYIMKLGTSDTKTAAIPDDKFLNLGTKYEGAVSAVNDGNDVYEAQYFNVNDSSYSKGDTYIISYSIEGASDFRQVATQSNLNAWSWGDSKKVWSGAGIKDGQDMTGDFIAGNAGGNISFKIRLDSPTDTASLSGTSTEITLKDLMVVKVANSDALSLPDSMELTKGRLYSGSINAVKADNSNVWNVQYFNVSNSAIKKDEQFKISFKISGIKDFKQLAVQTNVNGWDWDSAPKKWNGEGLDDDTTISAIITATEDCDNIAFKLWLDNPVNETFSDSSVTVQLSNLCIEDIMALDSLDEAYDGCFDVGAAVSDAMVKDVEYQNRIKGTFGTITAENEMKPDALLNKEASQAAGAEDPEAEPVLYLENSGMSRILDFAKENGLKVRGHALVYAAQTPDWFFNKNYEDGEDATPASATTMTARMQSYIKQVITFVNTNYPGVVTAWDVVNEGLTDTGYQTNKWYTTMGNTYIIRAFTYADTYAPDAELYYNDYRMENSSKMNTFLSRVYPSISSRIDGIGMQTHIESLTDPTDDLIQTAISKYNERNLDVQITELDVQIEANETLEQQAERYKELFTLFKNNSDAISNVTLWGINDGNSWRSSKRPLLFYDDLTPKPAFYSVLAVAKGEDSEE